MTGQQAISVLQSHPAIIYYASSEPVESRTLPLRSTFNQWSSNVETLAIFLVLLVEMEVEWKCTTFLRTTRVDALQRVK